MPNKTNCSGKCCAVGSAFKSLDGPCRKGVPADLLKNLIADAAKNGADEANQHCREGCACVGRFRVTTIGKSPIQIGDTEKCVFYVGGAFNGRCSTPGTHADRPADLDRDIERIVKRHERGSPREERPGGTCDERACYAIGNSRVTVDSPPSEGIDSELMDALIDAAASVARHDANANCPNGCDCLGEFFVTDSGAEPVRLCDELRYAWWIGGYWLGTCKRVF